MKFYLDTSTLYLIKQVPDHLKPCSFYSVFGLIEIITGVDEESFLKRKGALNNLMASKVPYEATFLEKILFDSFDYLKEDGIEFLEERLDDFKNIVMSLASAKNLKDFFDSSACKNQKYNFHYFKESDDFMSNNFRHKSLEGGIGIQSALKEGEATITLGGKSFDLSSRRKIFEFLQDELINNTISINALSQEFWRLFVEDKSEQIEEKIFASYNGNLNIFIKALNNYSSNQILHNQNPGRNDLADLNHLYYLQNTEDVFIVTNDKLFHKCIPERTISFDKYLKLNEC